MDYLIPKKKIETFSKNYDNCDLYCYLTKCLGVAEKPLMENTLQMFKVKRLNQINKDLIYRLAFITIIIMIFGMAIRNIVILKSIMGWDELGYWSNAAYMIGEDWSSAASTFSNYYSYGYSVFPALFLRIVKNGTIAYQCAIVLNGMFLTGNFVLLNFLGRLIFDNEQRWYVLMASAVATLYTNNLYQSNCAWTECELVFLFTLVITIAFSLERKYSFIKLLILVLLVIYTYFVHNRTLALLVALIITLIAGVIIKKIPIKHFIIISLCAFFALAIGIWIKNDILESVIIGDRKNELINNASTGIEIATANLTNKEGVLDIIRCFLCRFLYWGLTTFFAFYCVCIHYIRYCWNILKKREELSFAKMFFALCILGTFAEITLVLSNNHNYQSLLYGRYQDILIGPVYMVGLVLITKYIRSFKFILFAGTFTKVLIIIAEHYKIYTDYFVINCNTVLYKYWRGTENGGYDLWMALLVAVGVCILLIVINKVGVKNINLKLFLFSFISIVMSYISFLDSEKCFNDSWPLYKDNALVSISDIHKICENEDVIYYYNDKMATVTQPICMWLQLEMYDHKVMVYSEMEDLPEECYIVYPRVKQGDDYYVNTEIVGNVILENEFIVLSYRRTE